MGEKGSIFGKKRSKRDDDDDDDDSDDDVDDDVDLGVEGADVFSSEWLPSGDHKYVFFNLLPCSITFCTF